MLFDNLHDRKAISTNQTSNHGYQSNKPSSISKNSYQTYFQKQFFENQLLYDSKILKIDKRIHLGRANILFLENF